MFCQPLLLLSIITSYGNKQKYYLHRYYAETLRSYIIRLTVHGLNINAIKGSVALKYLVLFSEDY